MEEKTLTISMLSKANSVPGQGVGSAYNELLSLLQGQEGIQIVYKGKADIYHVHTVNPTFRRKMNKKNVSVMSVHFLPTTLDGSLKMPRLFFPIFKSYVLSTYKKAKHLVVVNPCFVDKLVELGFKRESIHYIPNVVSPSFCPHLSQGEKEAYREKLGIPRDVFVVLGAGQTQTRKGIFDFVEVAKSNPDMLFLWAGGFSFGRITDGYKRIKAIMDDPPPNVKFLGILPRLEMGNVYEISDCFFLPSFDELFPMTILEAASCQKPILLRKLALYEPILGDKCLYGESNEEFSSLLRKLASDSNFVQERVQSSMDISSIYGEDAIRNAWIEFYRSIAK